MILRDFAITISFILSLLLESLLDIGLIQNNGKYASHFSKSMIGMCIFDENDKPIMKSISYNDIDVSNKRIIDKDIGFYKVKIIEDLTSIINLQNEIREETLQIEEANKNLEKLIEITKEEASVNYHLSLINEIENSISKTKEEVLSLTTTLPEKNNEEAKKILGYIEMLLGYMKQKCMLLLKTKEENYISTESIKLLMNVASKDILSAGYHDVAVNVLNSEDVPISFVSTINDIIHEITKAHAFSKADILIVIDGNKKSCQVSLFKKKLALKEISFKGLKHRSNEDGLVYLWGEE